MVTFIKWITNNFEISEGIIKKHTSISKHGQSLKVEIQRSNWYISKKESL